MSQGGRGLWAFHFYPWSGVGLAPSAFMVVVKVQSNRERDRRFRLIFGSFSRLESLEFGGFDVLEKLVSELEKLPA